MSANGVARGAGDDSGPVDSDRHAEQLFNAAFGDGQFGVRGARRGAFARERVQRALAGVRADAFLRRAGDDRVAVYRYGGAEPVCP